MLGGKRKKEVLVRSRIENMLLDMSYKETSRISRILIRVQVKVGHSEKHEEIIEHNHRVLKGQEEGNLTGKNVARGI